jgi:DNA-binding IclR family transcriptional regulator
MKTATTILKVCRVFGAFHGSTSLGLTQVAVLTGLIKSDVHRILKSLEQFGYIEQDGERGRYRLGLELLELGHLVHQRLRLSDVARPVLCQLAEQSGGMVNLAVLDLIESKIVFIEQIGALSNTRIPWRIGQRLAFPHATAVGKILLAHLDPGMSGIVLGPKGLGRSTRHTITDEVALDCELQRVREQGYATDIEEAVIGNSCIGAPVRDYTRRVVGAVSVSMEAHRLVEIGERSIAAIVMSAAAKISGMLGGARRPVPVSINVTRVRSLAAADTTQGSRYSMRRKPTVTA